MSDADRQQVNDLDIEAADLVRRYLELGRVCIVIRADGEGRLQCISPDVDSATLARIAYLAADSYANHAADLVPPEQITRLG
ncbi:hypothetical protein ACN9MB_13110 [Dyella kyungheensis]|uniref:hypothetical protein n=1 Tax=Dyella kyungheensis TaxID=1242174 RepID=UPI003CF30840